MKKYAVLLFLFSTFFISQKSTAQNSTEHHIAPSPWQYWSDANEIVITTLATGIVNATISKSDGTEIITLALTSTLPAVYRFEGVPMQRPRNAINTVYNDRGIIVTSDAEIAVNVRNIASDDANTGNDDQGNFIKGNASLVSFGNAGKGTSFRLGYYRTNFAGVSGNAPVYSAMAIEDNTQVFLNNVLLRTLNAGQSYLFTAPIGAHLTSDKLIVANAGAYSDAPGGCADGIVTQVIPTQALGKNYIIVRGNGTPGTLTNYPEQSTIIATQPNTIIEISNYTPQGIFINTTTQTIANAGDSYTFYHGDAQSLYSSSYVEAEKPIIIYSGSADLCEVDMSTVIPIGDCTGSNEIFTRKFTAYNGNDLDAFGYIIVASATEPVLFNGTNLETLTATPRTSIGNSGYFILQFTNAQVGNPDNYHLVSNAKMTVSIVQQGNGFTMSGFFSAFNETITTPEIVSSENCNKIITTQAGFAPYQWYLNGVAIAGATSQTLSITNSGNYTVTGTMDCGITSQSSPLFVQVCSDLSITKEIQNTTNTGQITFIIKAKNNGSFQDTEVKVTDILPSGYTFVSASASVGTYANTTGIWNIGTLNVGQEETLQVRATVKETGNHTNIATVSGANLDTDQTNNSAQVTPLWNMKLTKIAQQPVYYNIGDIIIYDLVVTNTGNVNIYNISPIDANADVGSVSPAFIPILNVGESITITASHTITSADFNAGQVINQATVIGESFVDLFIRTNSDDPSTPAVNDPTVTPIIPEADLVTVKTNNQDFYIPGNDVVYTITVTNNGPGNAENVQVNDALPQGISIMNWTDSLGNSGNGALAQTLPTLQNGTSVIYTVTISVPQNYSGDLVNTAFVTSDTFDPNPNCDQCTDIDQQYIPEADLVTVKTDNQDFYISGNDVIYTITVTNNGPGNAENVQINDALPQGISIMNWTDNLGNSGNGALVQTLPTLQNGASVVYTVTISVPQNYSGDLVNTAVVTSDTFDPNPNCDQCTDIDQQYIPKADLVTVKTDNQDFYIPGTDVTYTITITNNGPDNAENVKVNDALPQGISIMNWTDNLGNSGNGALAQTLPTLQNGDSIIYTVTISVPQNYSGDLVNTAIVTSDTFDPNPNCDQCTDIDQQCTAPNPDCTNDVIPKGISPNGDNLNDFFDLSHLPAISKLEIFNRYGLLVYSQRNYKKEWNGKTDKGDDLPSGTYYYAIHFETQKAKTGWVYINR